MSIKHVTAIVASVGVAGFAWWNAAASSDSENSYDPVEEAIQSAIYSPVTTVAEVTSGTKTVWLTDSVDSVPDTLIVEVSSNVCDLRPLATAGSPKTLAAVKVSHDCDLDTVDVTFSTVTTIENVIVEEHPHSYGHWLVGDENGLGDSTIVALETNCDIPPPDSLPETTETEGQMVVKAPFVWDFDDCNLTATVETTELLTENVGVVEANGEQPELNIFWVADES